MSVAAKAVPLPMKRDQRVGSSGIIHLPVEQSRLFDWHERILGAVKSQDGERRLLHVAGTTTGLSTANL